MSADTTIAYLVTGASGCLGHALVRELLEDADREGRSIDVRAFDSRPGRHPRDARVREILGDVTRAADVEAACAGVDVVLHAAAIVDHAAAGEHKVFAVNVGGTQRVIDACRAAGARALVYTSTMDVVYDRTPISGGDESLPYPARFVDPYSKSKADAERAVLAANDPAGLRTCALRPCGLYGERDPYHWPPFLKAVRSGGLLFRMGDGTARFQHVYVGNVAWAHVLAAKRLIAGDERVAGSAYFLTDHPARNFFEFMEPFVDHVGLKMPPRSRYLSYGLAYRLASVAEWVVRALRPLTRIDLKLTRDAVFFVARDYWFTGARAREELGYEPRYSESEARRRTMKWFDDFPPR
ncbi:MAG: NAD-dependent epimerase/dehydratase family protein [Myxococcales bacterium]|nr:NAD-dependent epimerase/dehydratase family protein [Myxococcales bacterium]